MTIQQKHTNEILQELLDRVAAGKIEDFDFKKTNWFHDYTWTRKEEIGFIEWVAKFLRKHGYVKFKTYRGQDAAIYEAKKLVMNYGWKLKL